MKTVLDTFSRLQSAASPAARWLIAHEACAELGVEWMTQGSASRASLVPITVRSSAPSGLLRDYVSAGLPRRDLWLHHCASCTNVDSVGLDDRDAIAGDVLDACLADILRDYGARHVALIPVGSKMKVEALVVYATSIDGAERLACAAAGSELMALAALISALCPMDTEGVPQQGTYRWGDLLSQRERETLLWLAAGLRTAEIAHRMGIRPVTVGLHLQAARRKLGARTREQALTLALRDGHIAP